MLRAKCSGQAPCRNFLISRHCCIPFEEDEAPSHAFPPKTLRIHRFKSAEKQVCVNPERMLILLLSKCYLYTCSPSEKGTNEVGGGVLLGNWMAACISPLISS